MNKPPALPGALGAFLALALLLAFSLSGCGSSDTTAPPPGGGLTDQQKQQLEQAYQQVSTTADNLLKTADPVAGFQAALPAIRQQAGVDSAWVTGRALFVKLQYGGVVGWYAAPALQVPPFGRKPAAGRQHRSSKRLPGPQGALEQVGNKHALLINQQYDDESRQYCRDLISRLSQEFSANGYSVTTVNGTGANVAFFASSLKGYGAIFDISHGFFDGSNNWLCTGQHSTLDELVANYFDDWIHQNVTLSSIVEVHGGTQAVVRVVSVSNRFISAKYAGTDFPHSLIYLVACQSFKGGTQLGAAFTAKGAGAVVGWTETNCLGQASGGLLFDALLGGARLGTAFNQLPTEAVQDACEPPGATLTFFPQSEGTLQLVDTSTVSVVIEAPLDNADLTNRVTTLRGHLRGATLKFGTVQVNGVTTSLTVTDDSSFSQPLVLRSGANTIRVNAYGTKEDSTSAFESAVIVVYGQFASQALWTELRWNTDSTDVDFHLLPPGSTQDALWTDTDCFWSHRHTSWGATLDVDDVDGFGPEHITMDSVTTPGAYHVYVHYYNGLVPTSALVSVAALGGEIQTLGPYLLTESGANHHGDVWEICTIDFPSGVVTPVNRFFRLAKPTGPQPSKPKPPLPSRPAAPRALARR